MLSAKHFQLFLTILLLSSCQTPDNYFNRRDIVPAINNQCDGYRNGALIDTTNFISIDTEQYEYLIDYYSEHEYFHYKCKKFGRCK